MKKKKVFSKILAIVLVLSLSITVLQPLSVFAAENVSASETTQEKWVPSEEDMRLPNTEGDLTLEQLETAKLSAEDIPEYISQEDIEEKGHVNRLWEQEQDLNTVIFQNKDGTKTAYHYSDPVKYTDKNGKVKDKKNKLSETANCEYTNAENDINAYFPKKIHKNKGVELKFGEYVFEMSPNINGSSGASRQTGHDKDSNPTEYVEYPEVFADDISLRYTPTFGGYKEDIILAKNTGINRFEFKLTTNGLSLVQASTGNYYLAEPLTGEYVTALGNVIVYDNTGVESEGYNHYYEVTTLSQDEQYLISVIVDEDYLESNDTVYPVYVDPTLTVMPQGDVEDAVLYSDDSETAYSGLIKIGYDAAYGTGRGLYDFPILNFTNDFILMYGNQIKSAELNLYAQIQGSDRDNAKNLSLYEFHSDWSPSTVKWSNTDPDNYDTLVSSKSVTTGWTAFNILPVIEKFKSDSDYTMAFKGLLLKANSETYTTWKKFVSSYGTSSRRPYITITYNDSPTACSQVVSGATYYLKNYNGDYLDVYNGNTLDNTRLLTYAFHGDVNQQFKITNVYGGEYEIAPQHTAGKVLSVNSSGQVVIEEDCNLSRQRWYIFYRNGSYHIVNKAYNSGIMQATYDSDYVNIGSTYDDCCWEFNRVTVDDRDFNVLSDNDLALVLFYKSILASYKADNTERNKYRSDQIIREIRSIRNKSNYMSKYYGYNDCYSLYSDEKTTKYIVEECKTLTPQDISDMHNQDDIVLFIGSLVPGVGPFLGALGGVVSDIEQKESIDILGLSMSGVLEILSNSYGNGTVKVFSYLWDCFDLNESINQNGDKQFYVYEGIKLFEGDTLIKIKEEYDLGMVNSTYVGIVRNNCVLALFPYYAPRIDQPVDGYINQGYVNQLRSEWLEEGYIDAP